MTDPVFAALRGIAGRTRNVACTCAGVTNTPMILLAYVAASERFFWTCKPVQQQVMKVVRWSAEEAAATRDGVLWEALGLGKTAARVLEPVEPLAGAAAPQSPGF